MLQKQRKKKYEVTAGHQGRKNLKQMPKKHIITRLVNNTQRKMEPPNEWKNKNRALFLATTGVKLEPNLNGRLKYLTEFESNLCTCWALNMRVRYTSLDGMLRAWQVWTCWASSGPGGRTAYSSYSAWLQWHATHLYINDSRLPTSLLYITCWLLRSSHCR